jgi:hypothetical protein
MRTLAFTTGAPSPRLHASGMHRIRISRGDARRLPGKAAADRLEPAEKPLRMSVMTQRFLLGSGC